jgi:NAD(P)-dependent dehydrogenase (short-subunit alcohol dehydrogenase family)
LLPSVQHTARLDLRRLVASDDVAKFGAETPMKRPAQPEELAPAYVFLASSPCFSYITGEILPIIGGY